MHDNDFINSLSLLADMLYEIFIGEGRFPEEDELPLLKKYIQPLWFSLHNLDSIMSWNKKAVGFKEVHYQPLNFGAAALHFGNK